MLMPKRVKYRKMHRGNNRGMSHNGNTVAFGDFGLLAVEPAWITSRQIEAARRAISHHVKRGGKVCDSHLSGQADHLEACRNPHG